jgi:hypothetical protein
MNINRDQFEAEGYQVIRKFWSNGELEDLQNQLDDLGKLIVGPSFDSTRFSNYSLSPATQSLLYDQLKYLPALARMSGSVQLRDLCRQLGIGHPSLMGCCNMRLDKPGDAKHLFAWHQDTVYLLGSTNAVTVWIPLQDVDLHHGTIEVAPGTHRLGLLPFKRISTKALDSATPMLQRDLALAWEGDIRPVAIEAKRGDVVVFRQMLLHRSTANHSSQIRWTAQLRVTDLAEADHRQQGYPTGARTNVFYVDYPGHSAQTRRQLESGATSP